VANTSAVSTARNAESASFAAGAIGMKTSSSHTACVLESAALPLVLTVSPYTAP